MKNLKPSKLAQVPQTNLTIDFFNIYFCQPVLKITKGVRAMLHKPQWLAVLLLLFTKGIPAEEHSLNLTFQTETKTQIRASLYPGENLLDSKAGLSALINQKSWFAEAEAKTNLPGNISYRGSIGIKSPADKLRRFQYHLSVTVRGSRYTKHTFEPQVRLVWAEDVGPGKIGASLHFHAKYDEALQQQHAKGSLEVRFRTQNPNLLLYLQASGSQSRFSQNVAESAGIKINW